MIKLIVYLLFFLLAAVIFSRESIPYPGDSPKLKGPYLGQKLPGEQPQRFAPEVFFNRHTPDYFFEIHSSMVFSPDGNRLYYQKQRYDKKGKIYKKTNMIMKMENGIWSKPEAVNLFGLGLNVIPVFTKDGKRILFSYKSEGEADHKDGNKDIWMIEKTADGWGKPEPLNGAVNTPMVEAVPTVAGNGNLYFYRRCEKEDGSGEIFLSRYHEGKFLNGVRLCGAINSSGYEALPQVAPDESYLIFYRVNRAGVSGQYISFKRSDGSWTEARSMGDKVNSGGLAFGLSFSSDRKYVFYLLRKNETVKFFGPRREPGIYWLKADFITKLKQKRLKR